MFEVFSLKHFDWKEVLEKQYINVSLFYSIYSKIQQLILVLCERHESETSPSIKNYATYQSPTVVSRGHPGFPFDATF